jgi:hypothetical protein
MYEDSGFDDLFVPAYREFFLDDIVAYSAYLAEGIQWGPPAIPSERQTLLWLAARRGQPSSSFVHPSNVNLDSPARPLAARTLPLQSAAFAHGTVSTPSPSMHHPQRTSTSRKPTRTSTSFMRSGVADHNPFTQSTYDSTRPFHRSASPPGRPLRFDPPPFDHYSPLADHRDLLASLSAAVGSSLSMSDDDAA